MSKSPLANSKSALVFAGMTIVSALMIASPREGGGFLDNTVGRVAEQRENIAEEARVVSEEGTQVIEPLDPAAGWGGTGDPVFGSYGSEETPVSEEEQANSVSPAQSSTTSSAPASTSARRSPSAAGPIGGPVRADSPGVVVPRNGGEAAEDGPRGDPVVTSRTLKIEPQ